jgi:N-methylhydantoinase A
MHALDIADHLGIPSVVLPPIPGCHSAVGLVVTDISRDYVTTRIGRADERLESHLSSAIGEQRATAHADLADEGVGPEHRDLSSSLDMRYMGEQFSVNVPIRHHIDGSWLNLVVEDFHDLHEHLYGFRVDEEPVEVVNVRLRATGRLGGVVTPSAAGSRGTSAPAPAGSRRVAFGPSDDDVVETAVYERRELEPGAVFEGPAIIEQDDTTSIIPPAKHVRCDPYGNLIVTAGAS